jgi:hypothetical protein
MQKKICTNLTRCNDAAAAAVIACTGCAAATDDEPQKLHSREQLLQLFSAFFISGPVQKQVQN